MLRTLRKYCTYNKTFTRTLYSFHNFLIFVSKRYNEPFPHYLLLVRLKPLMTTWLVSVFINQPETCKEPAVWLAEAVGQRPISLFRRANSWFASDVTAVHCWCYGVKLCKAIFDVTINTWKWFEDLRVHYRRRVAIRSMIS